MLPTWSSWECAVSAGSSLRWDPAATLQPAAAPEPARPLGWAKVNKGTHSTAGQLRKYFQAAFSAHALCRRQTPEAHKFSLGKHRGSLPCRAASAGAPSSQAAVQARSA